MSIYIHHKNQNHFEPVLNVTASQVQTPIADWYTKYLENQITAKKKQKESSEYSKRQKMYNQSEEYKEKQRTNKQRKRFDPDIMNKEKVHKQSEEYKGKTKSKSTKKTFCSRHKEEG